MKVFKVFRPQQNLVSWSSCSLRQVLQRFAVKVTNVFSFIYLRFRFACDHFSCNIVCGTTNSKAIVLVIEARTLLVVLAG